MKHCIQILISIFGFSQMTVLQLSELIHLEKNLPDQPYLRPVLSNNLEKTDFNLFPYSMQQNNKIFLYNHIEISMRMRLMDLTNFDGWEIYKANNDPIVFLN